MRFDARRITGAAAAAVTAALLAPPGPAHAQTPPAEPYHLSADRLEGSTTTDENVLKATKVTVVHGATRVVGDSALIYQNREFVVFRGNVVVEDGTTIMRGEEASYDRKARRADLRGNVRIEDQGTVITGREATFYRAENRSVITGSPVLRDSARTLSANRIEYDRTREVVVAIGNVEAEDRAESTRVHAGRIRYDRRADYAWAQDAPRLTLLEAGGVATEIQADTLRFDNGRSRVYAIGDVHIDRDSLRATCGQAAFYRNEDRALLLDGPRAVSPEGTARGDTMVVHFRGGRVSSLEMRPHAVVEYQDRDRPGGERNVATGDTITLYLENDAAREAFIVGRATSEYWPAAADSAQGGRNTALGDTIRVEFEGGRPRRAIVLGRSQGTYLMAAEGDTAAAARGERIRYRGTRIEYDVEARLVDVIGAADVVYKEMHLTADRVHFDARTEKMRAQGEPVLQDGNDRIVGETMTYDLGIRRGTIYEGRTTYDRGFFAGEEVRRVTENVFNVRDGSYTTCDLKEPHYHFGSKKMRLVLREKVVAKPVVFYIKKIPVLALPFYIFPIKSGRHSGFQLPQVEFGSSSAGGKFIRNLGYYWAINDYLDATAWGDYYQDAQWIAHGLVRYNKRYYYSGQVSGSYLRSITSGTFQNSSWDLQGTHYQTLGPGITLRGLANMTNSSSYYRSADLGRSVTSRVQRNLRSSLALDRSWSNASLNIGLVRNQDLDPDPLGLRVEQQLPSASIRLSARPLGHEARGREPAVRPWLSKTLVAYSSSVVSQRNIFVNRFPTDLVEARQDSVIDARTAVRHDVTLTDNRNVGFLRLTTGMRYSEVFYSRDEAGNRNQRAGVWGSTFGLNSQVFGTFRRSIGPLRALRHVVTPSVGFAYQPSYPKLLYTRADGTRVARFSGVRGIAALGASEQRALQFSLRNDIHVKWGDPDQPKVINNLISMNTSGSYDFLAERSGRKPLSDIFTTLRVTPAPRNDFSFSFVHNPYDGRLLSFSATTGMSFSGRSGAATGTDQGRDLGYPNTAGTDPGVFLGGAVDPLHPSAAGAGLPWNASLSVAYSGARSRLAGGGYNPWGSTARANGSLGLNLSRNWRVEYAAQADLLAQNRDALGNRVGPRHVELVSQNFSVTRDLHCWQAQFTRSISGDVKEYYFKISVKNLPEVYYEQGSRGLRGFGGVDRYY